MKKVLAILLAGALTLGMSVTAFATSPSGTQNQGPKATMKGGTVETATDKSAYTADEWEAVEDIRANAADILAETVEKAADAKGMSLLSVFDVEIKGWDFSKGPATVTFAFPTVKVGSKVIVLHYTNGAWEQVPAKAGDGTITVTLESTSPIAVFVEKSASASVTSPQTGEAPVMPIVAAVAVLAVAGMAVSARRRHA